VTDDLVAAAQAMKDVGPAAQEFARATGLTAPLQELTGWLADLIRYRRAPHQAVLLQRAADKIRASGLPAHAVQDRLLRNVLEEGSFEEDDAMVDRWANLLANAATSEQTIPIAFPDVLRQLEPIEALVLDRLVEAGHAVPLGRIRISGFTAARADNLVRLALAYFVVFDDVYNSAWDVAPRRRWGVSTFQRFSDSGEIIEMMATEFGKEFVAACRAPKAP
jgi:hypothetical protein